MNGPDHAPIRIFHLVRPRLHFEPILYHTTFQPDPVPEGGIWQIESFRNLDTSDPFIGLRCIAPWGCESVKQGEFMEMRKSIFLHCFERAHLEYVPYSVTADELLAQHAIVTLSHGLDLAERTQSNRLLTDYADPIRCLIAFARNPSPLADLCHDGAGI